MSRKPFPTPADKAKRTLLGIDIPRDELAFVIAQASMGLRAPLGTNIKDALDMMDTLPTPAGCPPMGVGFRRAADQAVAYFHERINAARQPS